MAKGVVKEVNTSLKLSYEQVLSLMDLWESYVE